ncbi:hypothetical protein, partial [Escherichia coli]|uniref:hypothetical protein n=1 Tax=Escherichia coli TaxID=562 RepID=UPI00207C09B9
PTALTACSRRLSAILTALSSTPSNQKSSRLFHAQREKYSHSVVSLRHRSGDAIYPLKRGLFPRHLRVEKTCFLCTYGSLTDPAATRAGSTKSRSKKLCKLVHYRANKKKRLIGALKISIVAVY